jgi:transcriptional regulator with GAF, ATPase, and Fis domain/Tfp pilus assembly protein PilF
MSEQSGGYSRPEADYPRRSHALDAEECDRLEEIGDLHAQASAYSSSLEYYRRLLEGVTLRLLAPARRAGVLRKSVDAALNIGDLDLAESLLGLASNLFHDADELTAEERAHLLAPLMGRRAILLSQRGLFTDALQTAKHAFAILAVTDEHREVANLQVTMGACHQRLGRPDKAEEFYLDALSSYRRIGDELGAATLHNNLGLLHKNACRWNRALDLLEKAVAIAQRHGATHLLARLHLNRGIILGKTGRLGEAREDLDRSLRLARSLGDRNRQTKVCLAFGRLEMQAGRLVKAEEFVLEGKILAEQERYLREETIADEYLGDILLLRGETEKALFNYSLGLDKSRTIGKVCDLEGELLRRVAEALRMRGDLEQAIETGLAAVAVCEKCGEQYELGFCHLTLGRARAARGDFAGADAEFRRAIQLFRQQNLPRLWIDAILAFLDARLATAAQPEFLLLRRYLNEAQESGSAVLDDRLLCRLQQGLAEVQMRLGQFDDALLTAYELERNAGGLGDAGLSLAISDLRGRIERALLGDLGSTENHLQAISGIPGIFSWHDASIPRNLTAVLRAGMDRVRADHGFIALDWSEAGIHTLRVVAREGLSDNLSDQLGRWYRTSVPASVDLADPVLFSRLSGGEPLLAAVPALRDRAAGCLFMPITLEGRRFGVLYLGRSSFVGGEVAFGRPALDFLATYMGFLALFLFEKGRGRLPGEPVVPVASSGEIASFDQVITENEQMLELLALIRKVAPSDLTVLLTGETGTGKGLLAQAVHALSRRHGGRFLAINCAAIPETLLESELFGHVKGSFTGAIGDKRGLLAEAEGGTVFLDEIGKMPLSMQGKLLQFLDTRIIRPVGSNQERQVDVRIICASKSDLHDLTERGLFLEDLFYRLLDFPLVVPPLRTRRDDIQLLVHHFIERFAGELGIAPPGYTSSFMDALVAHDWPGNIRELEKSVRRAIVLAQEERVLKPEHLPREIGAGRAAGKVGRPAPLRETLATVECREIAATLRLTGGNKSETARMLEISYPNLLKKIRFYGLQTF